jgi:hypothetical protein
MTPPTTRRRPCPTIGLLPVVLGLAFAVPGLRAADDRIAEERDATGGEPQRNPIDLGANFDVNLFEQQGGWVIRGGPQVQRILVSPTGVGPVDVESPALAWARAQADSQLQRIERLCVLDESQRRSLRLAMESDIRRFAERIDAERGKYAGVTVSMQTPEGQKAWQQFQADVQRCRRQLDELFASGSLFAATIASTLDAAQFERLAAEIRAKRAFRWRALVASGMLKLDDALGLAAEQHRVIEEMLLAREPALRIEGGPRQPNPHAEQMLVYLMLSQVDQQQLRAAVSPRQWPALVQLANQGKAMRSWLEQQRLLDSAVVER